MNEMSLHEPIFVDTWGWLALGHRHDESHAKVKQILQRIRQDGVLIYTSDYVLNELITLLFRRENFNESIRFINSILTASVLYQLKIERITSDRFVLAWELRKQYKDKPYISFTDLTSMVIMQEYKIKFILTEDKHFLQVGMGFSIFPQLF
jgi:predicted nucleic acid-binding protein